MNASQSESVPDSPADHPSVDGERLGPIPRGVEVLVRKASVDPEFKRLLLTKRTEAARQIDLSLEPVEAAMLAAVPAEQLEAIIARTTVPQEHRRTFLGTAAATMLAAVGLIAAGCNARDPSLDRQGRPTRNRTGEAGGAAPDEPFEEPPNDGAGSEAPSAGPATDDSAEAPPPDDGAEPPSSGSRDPS